MQKATITASSNPGQATPKIRQVESKIAQTERFVFVAPPDSSKFNLESKSDDEKQDVNPSVDESVVSTLMNGGRSGLEGKLSRIGRIPPSFNPTIKFSRSFYFRTHTGTIAATDITVGMLLGLAGGIVTVANTTLVTYCSSFKLKSVKLWLAEGSVTSNPEIAFPATGYSTNPDYGRMRAVPTGVVVGGGFSWSPPPDSFASLWQNATASAVKLFTLYDVPVGCIIAIEGSWTCSNGIGGLATTIASGALGAHYYLNLDGNGGKTLALGLPSTN